MDDPVEVLRDFAAGVCDDPACQDCQEDHRPTIANAIDAVLSERDALREENARLKAERQQLLGEVFQRASERDEARAEVVQWKVRLEDEVARVQRAEAEVARLEGLILDWVNRYESDGFTGMGSLLTEGRRIRAQREEGR